MASCQKISEGLKLTLEAHEVDLLHFLGRELRRLVRQGDPDQPNLRPFFPSQQRKKDGESVAAGMENELDLALIEFRLERIEEVQRDLLHREDDTGILQVVLDESAADTWLAYLTDLRLLLSAVVGITHESPNPFAEQDESSWTSEMRMYEFLSVLQEWILAAVMEPESP